MSNHKIYQVGTALFIYKKNATATKKEKGGEIKETSVAEKIFREKFYTFSDCAEFEKKNKKFFENEDKAVKMVIEKMAIKPETEPKPKPSHELTALTALVEDLQKQLSEMKTANETLKNGKVKLSFEDAQELYAKKSELLRSISKYDTVKEKFLKLEIKPNEDEILEANGLSLVFRNKQDGYREDDLLKTSSMLIIHEFVPFIIEKLSNKIELLKQEVETIDFV